MVVRSSDNHAVKLVVGAAGGGGMRGEGERERWGGAFLSSFWLTTLLLSGVNLTVIESKVPNMFLAPIAW